jgi:putative flippase GtrA
MVRAQALQQGTRVVKTPAQLTGRGRLASIFRTCDLTCLPLAELSSSAEQRQLVSQFVRFIAVGAANLIVSYGTYLASLWVAPPFVAMLLASASGLVFNSILNVHYVFKKKIDARSFFIPAACYVVYTALSAASVDILVRFFGLPAAMAPIPVLCVLVPLNFAILRFMILQTPEARKVPTYRSDGR